MLFIYLGVAGISDCEQAPNRVVICRFRFSRLIEPTDLHCITKRI